MTRSIRRFRPFLVPTLRLALVGMGLGSLFVQWVLVPLMAIDLEEADPDAAHLQLPFAVLGVLGVLSIQVALVCVWRLVSMVDRGTVFTTAAFRLVDPIIGACAAAAVIAVATGCVLAPGDAVPPGFVLLLGIGAVAAGGIGLLVLVLRLLLEQAISRDAEAAELQAELDEVI